GPVVPAYPNSAKQATAVSSSSRRVATARTSRSCTPAVMTLLYIHTCMHACMRSPLKAELLHHHRSRTGPPIDEPGARTDQRVELEARCRDVAEQGRTAGILREPCSTNSSPISSGEPGDVTAHRSEDNDP